jgi:hypothetical protein
VLIGFQGILQNRESVNMLHKKEASGRIVPGFPKRESFKGLRARTLQSVNSQDGETTMTQENSPSQMTNPHARKLLRVSSVSVAKIEAAGGMEFVCMAVMQGMPHSHIAEALGIARSDLGGWLHNQNDPSYHLAMLTSAEALYDRAEDVLCQAKGGTMADVQIAREIAGLCIRTGWNPQCFVPG